MTCLKPFLTLGMLFLTVCQAYKNGQPRSPIVLQGSPPYFDHEVDLATNRSLNIAHQGSSGRLPPQTLPAFILAVEEGADIIECDMSFTKDLVLICVHEAWLGPITNIADIYPEDRMNTYYIIDKDENITDYFTVDFTLEELRQVGVRQRDDTTRDPNFDGMFTIATVEEYIQVALNASRPIGVYPETKESVWHNSLDILQEAGTTFEDLILDLVEAYGYGSATDPCFLQSFQEESIRYMSEKTDLPVIQLLREGDDVSDEYFEHLSEFCYGIGARKSFIVEIDEEKGSISGRTDLVDRAHAKGLRVHPWTMRNEDRYLVWDYGQDPWNEYQDYLDLGVDGVFTDFPGTYDRFLDVAYSGCGTSQE